MLLVQICYERTSFQQRQTASFRQARRLEAVETENATLRRGAALVLALAVVAALETCAWRGRDG